MSDRKLYSTGNSNTTGKDRDAAYWDKLRKEFQSGQHQHSGAYCSSAFPKIPRNPLS